MTCKIRVGIIGARSDRGWASMAHVPALQALSDYEITALSTTRQKSADEAAHHFGVPRAFDNYRDLVSSPDVDLVVVTVKVPHHFELTSAALEAGKHVYCEWPLGNGLAEAQKLAALAKQKGLKAVVGLQTRCSPVISYVRDLVAKGYVGDVLSTSLIGSGIAWGEHIDAANAYIYDKSNGATLLSIPVGHMLDTLCSVLGEIGEVSALTANRRTSAIVAESGQSIPVTSEDQIAFVGRLTSGAVLSVHYRGGMSKGTNLLWEINGTYGDLRLTYTQTFDLELAGANGNDKALQPLATPESHYSTKLHNGLPMNVAEVYARLARDLREGTSTCPSFDDAVVRHKMLDAISSASETGVLQSLRSA